MNNKRLGELQVFLFFPLNFKIKTIFWSENCVGTQNHEGGGVDAHMVNIPKINSVLVMQCFEVLVLEIDLV